MALQDTEESLMISTWPTFTETFDFPVEEMEIEMLKGAVRAVRNLRSEMNVPPSKKAKIFVVAEDEKVRDIFSRGELFFASLAFGSQIAIQNDMTGIASDAVSVILPQAVVYIPFDELVDREKELARLEKEKDKLTKEVDRVDKKLSNEGFVAKAPAHLIEEEKAKKEKYQAMLQEVIDRLNKLK
jgi:valyl-tRNA synthetase